MTGPEHYRRAEYWADLADSIPDGEPRQQAAIGLGAIHAALAQAAALVDATNEGVSDLTAWREAQDPEVAARNAAAREAGRRAGLEDAAAAGDVSFGPEGDAGTRAGVAYGQAYGQ